MPLLPLDRWWQQMQVEASVRTLTKNIWALLLSLLACPSLCLTAVSLLQSFLSFFWMLLLLFWVRFVFLAANTLPPSPPFIFSQLFFLRWTYLPCLSSYPSLVSCSRLSFVCLLSDSSVFHHLRLFLRLADFPLFSLLCASTSSPRCSSNVAAPDFPISCDRVQLFWAGRRSSWGFQDSFLSFVHLSGCKSLWAGI